MSIKEWENKTQLPWTGDILMDAKLLWEAIPEEVRNVLRLSWSDTEGILSGHFQTAVLRPHFGEYLLVVYADWAGKATLERTAISIPQAIEILKDHANERLGLNSEEAEGIETQDLPVLKSTDSVFIREGVIYLVEGKDMEAVQKWAKEVNQQNPSSIKGIIIK